MNQHTEIPEQSCSIHSSLAQEPLIGSASRTDYWILLEYPYPPPANALQGNRLPDEINHYMAAVQSTLPNSRLLLIRKKSSFAGSHPILYLADGREGHAHLYKFPLSGYSDLLKLDISSIFTGGITSSEALCNDHIFLVCTNGKRDACCSKWGLPLYNALEEQYNGMVWQSSHLGGHRFAPNFVCLPHGIYYGRLPLEQAIRIAERHNSGHLTLEYYRGCAAYPPPVQAAEYFLRLETKDDRIGIYHLDKFSSISENQWEISFSDTRDQFVYRIEIESCKTGVEIFESCNSPFDRKSVKEFRLRLPIQGI